jgi:hypothetical protein
MMGSQMMFRPIIPSLQHPLPPIKTELILIDIDSMFTQPGELHARGFRAEHVS